jgi:hypothetical protein
MAGEARVAETCSATWRDIPQNVKDKWERFWVEVGPVLHNRFQFVTTCGATPLLPQYAGIAGLMRASTAGHEVVVAVSGLITGSYGLSVHSCMKVTLNELTAFFAPAMARAIEHEVSAVVTLSHEGVSDSDVSRRLEKAIEEHVVALLWDIEHAYAAYVYKVFAYVDRISYKEYGDCSLTNNLSKMHFVCMMDACRANDRISDAMLERIVVSLEARRADTQRPPESAAAAVQRIVERRWAIIVGLHGPQTMRELHAVNDVFRIVLGFL